jgi:hypothetical protein
MGGKTIVERGGGGRGKETGGAPGLRTSNKLLELGAKGKWGAPSLLPCNYGVLGEGGWLKRRNPMGGGDDG